MYVQLKLNAMIRKSIFTLMLMAIFGYVSAQSLQFEYNGTIYQDGSTIVCNTEEYGEFIQYFQVRNLDNVDHNVMLEKEVAQDLEGVMNYFCWGSCYLPETVITPRPVAIPANSLSEDELSVHAMFDDFVFGYIIVKYSIYDEATPNDRVTVAVKFHKSGEGVNENASIQLGQAYPNPASSMVHFDYENANNATAVIYNLLGQEVMHQELNAIQGKLSISVADLQDGIYFCNLTRNGQTMRTVKFVVKK